MNGRKKYKADQEHSDSPTRRSQTHGTYFVLFDKNIEKPSHLQQQSSLSSVQTQYFDKSPFSLCTTIKKKKERDQITDSTPHTQKKQRNYHVCMDRVVITKCLSTPLHDIRLILLTRVTSTEEYSQIRPHAGSRLKLRNTVDLTVSTPCTLRGLRRYLGRVENIPSFDPTNRVAEFVLLQLPLVFSQHQRQPKKCQLKGAVVRATYDYTTRPSLDLGRHGGDGALDEKSLRGPRNERANTYFSKNRFVENTNKTDYLYFAKILRLSFIIHRRVKL